MMTMSIRPAWRFAISGLTISDPSGADVKVMELAIASDRCSTRGPNEGWS